MNINDYGFHFEEQGLSGEEGPIDPSQQYFEGSHADHAVVRETGQNTLDNRGTDVQGPIRMEFQLASMKTDAIPGIEQLRSRLDAVAEQTVGQQGHDRMVRAAELARQDEIVVLRISDYNTTGLTGRESLTASGSPLSRMTRGKGGSSDDGKRGGSFGIGSAVGPMASHLSTVLYVSMPEDKDETVMAGYVRLATHVLDGTSYRAEGYFTRLGQEDFEYLRPAPVLGPFPARTEPGTDIYVLGYRMAEQDPELERVRDAAIDNFMAAIHQGRLVVRGIAPGNDWTLDQETLEGFAKRRPETHAFYVALQDKDPAEGEVPHVGKVRLYVNVDDRLTRKLNTITMRAPLMKIDTFRHNSISAKYAAVLVCDDPDGNAYLRGLEPPQHHEWDGAREPKHGNAVVSGLKKFTLDALRERISVEVGDVVEIDGLARFLPTDSAALAATGNPALPSSAPESEGTQVESGSVVGDPAASTAVVHPPNKKVRVTVRRPAISDDEADDDVEKGRDSGGTGTRKGKGGPLPGSGDDGDGTSRIRGHKLHFRSWSGPGNDAETAVITVSVTAKADEVGDLELVALGAGGAPERDYRLPISRALVHTANGPKELAFTGNTLKDLSLTAGVATRIDVHVPAGERYRLEAL